MKLPSVECLKLKLPGSLLSQIYMYVPYGFTRPKWFKSQMSSTATYWVGYACQVCPFLFIKWQHITGIIAVLLSTRPPKILTAYVNDVCCMFPSLFRPSSDVCQCFRYRGLCLHHQNISNILNMVWHPGSAQASEYVIHMKYLYFTKRRLGLTKTRYDIFQSYITSHHICVRGCIWV